MNNDNLLNAIQIVSFIVGVLNYNENLTQTDKEGHRGLEVLLQSKEHII
jgi:hypothetical protein